MDESKRGSSLARILRNSGKSDPEVEQASREYTNYWLNRLGGLRRIPPPALALLNSQKILLRGLLALDQETTDRETGGIDTELLKLAVPISNSLRLGEVRLEKLANHGSGKKRTLSDVMAKYAAINGEDA